MKTFLKVAGLVVLGATVAAGVAYYVLNKGTYYCHCNEKHNCDNDACCCKEDTDAE